MPKFQDERTRSLFIFCYYITLLSCISTAIPTGKYGRFLREEEKGLHAQALNKYNCNKSHRMADKDDGQDEDVKPNDKHNWGAADLEKVNIVEEDKDDLKMSSDAIGKIISHPQQPRQKVVNIKKDDLELIMHELELPKSMVEKKLIEVNGDVIAAIKSFMGFD